MRTHGSLHPTSISESRRPQEKTPQPLEDPMERRSARRVSGAAQVMTQRNGRTNGGSGPAGDDAGIPAAWPPNCAMTRAHETAARLPE